MTETTHNANPHLTTQWRSLPPPGAESPPISVVLVHGRGQSPDYMADIAARVGMNDLHLFYPAARENSWYPKRFMNPLSDNEPDLDHALDAMAHAVRTAKSVSGDLRRVVVIGFSQGACLLAEFLARTTSRLGAAVLLTGGYIGPPGTRHVTGHLDAMPIILSSSDIDEWVPPERVRDTARLFEQMGADVRIDIHHTEEHTVNDNEIDTIRRLLDSLRRN